MSMLFIALTLLTGFTVLVIVGGTFLKVCLFTFDKLAIFVAVAVNAHKYFSTKVASGNAVYFWDILAAIIAVALYAALFKLVRQNFALPGKILNFVISFFSAYIVYFMLVSICVYHSQDVYYLPLLNNSVMNKIVNWIIVCILSCVIWFKREEYLVEKEEYDLVGVERMYFAKKEDEKE